MLSRIIKPKNRRSLKSDSAESGMPPSVGSRSVGSSAKLSTGGGGTRATIPPAQSYTAPQGALLDGAAVTRLKTSVVDAPYANGAPTSALEPLPAFRDVPSTEHQSLFLRKLSLCKVLFDFTDPTKNVKEKEIKRQTLSELVDYFSVGTGKFTELMIEECFKMVRVNIFRAFPTACHDTRGSEGFEADEEEPAMEPAWPHLQLVYEFLMRYVLSDIASKKYIDHSFVVSLLDLFDSEDPREREALKAILHRIYGKFVLYRPFIRKSINNVFYCFIFETERHNGIFELLEIIGSIINGFALPLKEEHKLFLVRTLIPLHKPKCLVIYQQQLSYCVTQFVEKDFRLADTVIRGLLKYWPVTNSQKEVLVLGELEEVLEATQPAEFQRCMVPLFKRIARCLNSLHFQI